MQYDARQAPSTGTRVVELALFGLASLPFIFHPVLGSGDGQSQGSGAVSGVLSGGRSVRRRRDLGGVPLRLPEQEDQEE